VTKGEPITLANLANGAAVEKFGIELQRVLDNIVDPNTKADAVREVILKVKIKPNDKRELGAVSIETGVKLAGDAPYETTVQFGSVGGKGRAEEFRSTMPLFGKQGGADVIGINRKPQSTGEEGEQV
jgi:hypothetical protein